MRSVRITTIFLIILQLFYTPGIFGQSAKISFKHITSDQGLASNRILSITQDKTGFMWFGTEDGLVRFDGINFINYKHSRNCDHCISHNKIFDVTEDTVTGNLWIATGSGINLYNRKEDKIYTKGFMYLPPKDSSLINIPINQVIIDSKQHIWICTGGRIYDYAGPHSKPYIYKIQNRSKSSVHNSFQFVFEDSKKQMWVGTRGKVYRVDTVHHKMIPLKLPVDSIEITHLYEDKKKHLWVSTMNDGVFEIKPEGIKHFSKENNYLRRNRVFSVVEDDRGNMFFSVRDGGLHYWDWKTDKVTLYTPDLHEPKSINSSAPTCLFKDKHGNIWVGTYSNGINFIDRHQKQFYHYKVNFKSDGIFCNNIRTAFQDSDGDIWIGTRDGGGLSKFNPVTGTFVNYKPGLGANSLNNDYVLTITEIKPGKLLIGTHSKGLSIFDKKTGLFKYIKVNPKDEPNLSGKYIFCVYKDRYESIWVASQTTLYTFDYNKLFFKTRFKIKNVRCVLDFSPDRFYFVSSGFGIYEYNRQLGTIKEHSNNPNDPFSISNENIYGIDADSNGNIWLATNGGGLNKFDPKTGKFNSFTTTEGLPANNISGVLVDKRNQVWISTSNGLAKFYPETKKVRIFNLFDGLQGNEFERQACFRTKTGEMIFGGANGFNYFHPDSIRDNPVKPQIEITDFKLFNKPVVVNAENSPLKQSIGLTNELKLTHKQTTISFDFIALNYTSPENNQYAYMLQGLESEWNYIGNKHNANFTSLPAGTYLLRIKASNNDGIWDEHETPLKIIVLPPWWKTWWFKLFVVFFIVSAAIAYFLYRTRALRIKNLKLAMLVRERTRQIEIQNTQLKDQKGLLEEQKEVLEEQNAEIASQRDNVLKLNSKLKRSNELRTQFFTNISHEFRTPLTLLIGPVEKLLENWPQHDKKFEQLLLIKRYSNKLLTLINELMDFRSIETNKAELHIAQSNIVKFVSDVAQLFNTLAEQKKIIFTVNHDQGEIEAWFDRAKLEKIIFNVLSNAFKYTSDNGKIEVFTRMWDNNGKPPGDAINIGKPVPGCKYLEIGVKDSGCGISPENLQQIFSEFYREPSSKATATGSGIGLALTKELVKLHKGLISVQSQKGVGTFFAVKLPIHIDFLENYIIEESPDFSTDFSRSGIDQLLDIAPYENMGQATEKGHRKEAILIAEDNNDLRRFIADQLSDVYKILEAPNGTVAFEMAAKYTPGLIISDIMMPEMNGIELCKKLKADLHTCHIPVILLTALTETEQQLKGLETGADDYVTKPFEIKVLEARVQNLIQSRNRLKQLFGSPANISAGEITENPKEKDFIQKALDIVNENIADASFGVNELAEKMFISRSLLHKKLVSIANQAPVDFITTIRLKRAIQLMANPNLNITEIAELSGYNDLGYFGRCFKKNFGTTPKNYAESLKKSRL